MARDNRFRKYSLDANYALIDGDGVWHHIAGTLPELISWYVNERCTSATLHNVFDARVPESWEVVCRDMLQNGYQLRQMDKKPTFSVKHADLAEGIARDGVRGVSPWTDERHLMDEELVYPTVETLGITNPLPAVEDPDDV